MSLERLNITIPYSKKQNMYKLDIQSITDMSLPELETLCTSIGEPGYRAKQIFSWVYDKGATTFDEMSNLPKDFRKQL